jgi:hypothetical protein
MPTIGKVFVERLQGQELRLRMINSSNVHWVAWPRSGEPVMLVKFKRGYVYAYLGVTRQKAVAAAHAPSTGHYINKKIKPHYAAVQIKPLVPLEVAS